MTACNDNIILATDSYKISHHFQYPPDTTKVYSYFESRGGKWTETLFFGLQYFIKKWLTGPVVTPEKIAEAKEVYAAHFGSDKVFDVEGWQYIVDKHGGCLPLTIRAVPEGTVLPYKNVLFTVENTDPKCFWLTNYLETLLVQVWYPMTVATNSREQKVCIADYLADTADNSDGLPFKLHDFGFRGVSSVESAAIGGAAHLVNFMGTDTIAGLIMLRDYYSAPICGFSIPASEHSTITSWTKEGEKDAFLNMLKQFPEGLVACVSDSYDIWHACSELWGTALKEEVVKRAGKGTLVVRPDSGDPPEIVVKCLELLESKFGSDTNSKGYKVLPPYLRLIQGDGINIDMLHTILRAMKAFKWSADNVAFGSGGGLLQKLNRDTQKCAYKCSFATVGGKDRDVFKAPVTDKAKKSKKGHLTLEKQGDNWVTVQQGAGKPEDDKLVTVFENGKLLKEYTLEEVRKNAELTSTSPTPEVTREELGAWAQPEAWTAWAKQHLS